jgi:SAM-dependent methyltransferase
MQLHGQGIRGDAMARDHPTPFGVDSERPSTARIYDYFLGGKDNYRADRDAAEQMMAAVPESVATVQSNRAFLYRAVTFLAREAGITQFLDVGSGLPTQLNVHQVAQNVAPNARVVYVDYDPSVRAYGDVLLSTSENVRFALQDLRRPSEILADPAVVELIDLEKPVAILLISILPFISEADDPDEIMAQLRAAMAPGSYLVISHILDDPRAQAIASTQRHARTHPWTPRTRSRIGGFFEGFDLVEPGLTMASQWRPELAADEDGFAQPGEGRLAEVDWLLAGVGRKR